MAKRSALTNLSERLAPKPAPAAARSAAEPDQAERSPGRRQRAKTQPDGRKGVLVRLNTDAWRQLKGLSADEMKSLQELMEEAINDRLAKAGRPRVA